MLDYPVVTPENIAFDFTVAGPASRLVAWLLDMLFLTSITALLGIVVGMAASWWGDYALAIYGVLSLVLFLGYWIFFELRWQGRTPGKRLLGLRVVGECGLPLATTQVLLRNLLRPVDFMPGAAGLAALFCAGQLHHRRIGDLVAGTLVIRERRPLRPQAILSAEVRAQLQAVSSEVALPTRLSTRLSADEIAFVLDLCRRRDSLLNAVRKQLFGAVSRHLSERLGILQQDGLSGETLVLLLCAQLLKEGDTRFNSST